ncbi:MAG TPA: MXAN_5187 C-terminal domain-containing protein [Thermoanaerobaculia bacterium]|nr:MXAN_5187 C-terminal domain-containing protein [Thermoanaerobaculia bacterium]
MATIEHDLDRLSREIDRLKVDFDRFFNGALEIPPEDDRLAIRDTIRQLHATNMTSHAENFRLSSLEARFNSLSELSNRRLRERESGPRQQAAASLATPRPSARVGIALDQDPAPEAAETLFNELYRLAERDPKTDLESFRRYLASQVARIQEKTGCDQVEFRVASVDGKLKLKARPLSRRR